MPNAISLIIMGFAFNFKAKTKKLTRSIATKGNKTNQTT